MNTAVSTRAYCPICQMEYDGEFCVRCKTRLPTSLSHAPIEKMKQHFSARQGLSAVISKASLMCIKLVLDVSSSMGMANKLQLAKEAIWNLLILVDEVRVSNVLVSLVTFSDSAKTIFDSRKPSELLADRNWLDSIQTECNTRLSLGMAEAERIGNGGGGRCEVFEFIVSDLLTQNDHMEVMSMAEKFKNNDEAALVTVLIGDDGDFVFMRKIATSEGHFHVVDSPEKLQGLFMRFGRIIKATAGTGKTSQMLKTAKQPLLNLGELEKKIVVPLLQKLQ